MKKTEAMEDSLNYQPDGEKPKGKFIERKVAVMVVVALVVIIMFLTAMSGDKKAAEEPGAPAGQEQKEQDEAKAKSPANLDRAVFSDGRREGQVEQRPAAAAAAAHGHAQPTPSPKGEERVNIIGPAPVDPEAQEKLRQKGELARKKFSLEQEAFKAGLVVKQNGTQATQAKAEPAPPAADRVTGYEPPATGDNYDMSPAMDKERFFERADQSQWISPYTREAGRPYELKTGSVIPGVMVTGINSDLPGNVIGQVAQDVFDTATGRYLLVPKGSKVYGVYDARVSYGQRRALVAWNRVIFPDGSSVTLGAMPGSDAAGQAGFEDRVDNHYARIFGSAVLMSLITGGTAYATDRSNDKGGDDDTSFQDEMQSALASQLGQAAAALIQKNLSISPTITIRPGYEFNIVAAKDIVFHGPYGK